MVTSPSDDCVRPERERARTRRWVQSVGAHVLVVDAARDDLTFDAGMSARGVHVTRVDTTIDGLIEFGRTNPEAVLVSPRTAGIPPAEFVRKLLEYGRPAIIALMEDGDAEPDGALFLAGATRSLERPYTAEAVWTLLQQSAQALDDHAHVVVGPITLDASAYTVHLSGTRAPNLPLKEFELLRALMYRAPEMMTDDEIRREVWGRAGETAGDGTIRVHVRRLRARLDGFALIRRVHGRGYALTTD